MTRTHRVGVVIPTYQRCEAVRQLLEQLARRTAAADEYEVIVSIDGSDDGTREMATQSRAPYALRVLWQEHGAGRRHVTPVFAPHRGSWLSYWTATWRLRRSFSGRTRKPAALSHGVAYSAQCPSKYLTRRRLWQPTLLRNSTATLRNSPAPITSSPSAISFFRPTRLLMEVRLFDERSRSAATRIWTYRCVSLAGQSYTKTFPELARDTIAKGHTAVQLASKHPQAFHELQLATFHGSLCKWRCDDATLPPRDDLGGEAGYGGGASTAAPTVRLCDFTLGYLHWLGAGQASGDKRFRKLLLGAGTDRIEARLGASVEMA